MFRIINLILITLMKKIGKLKLNVLSDSELTKREMQSLQGGTCWCFCGGLDQTIATSSEGSYGSPGNCSCGCGCSSGNTGSTAYWAAIMSKG